MPLCDECGEEFNPEHEETVCKDCKKLSPCCGVEFDKDTEMCPECGEHI